MYFLLSLFTLSLYDSVVLVLAYRACFLCKIKFHEHIKKTEENYQWLNVKDTRWDMGLSVNE